VGLALLDLGRRTVVAGSKDRPQRWIRLAPWLSGMAQICCASASGGKFTTKLADRFGVTCRGTG